MYKNCNFSFNFLLVNFPRSCYYLNIRWVNEYYNSVWCLSPVWQNNICSVMLAMNWCFYRGTPTIFLILKLWIFVESDSSFNIYLTPVLHAKNIVNNLFSYIILLREGISRRYLRALDDGVEFLIGGARPYFFYPSFGGLLSLLFIRRLLTLPVSGE